MIKLIFVHINSSCSYIMRSLLMPHNVVALSLFLFHRVPVQFFLLSAARVEFVIAYALSWPIPNEIAVATPKKNNNRQQNIKHNSNVIENTLTFRCDTFWCARLLSFPLNWISIDWSQTADRTKSSILISCRLKSTGDVEFYQFQKCNNVSQTRIIIKTKKREKNRWKYRRASIAASLCCIYILISISWIIH